MGMRLLPAALTVLLATLVIGTSACRKRDPGSASAPSAPKPPNAGATAQPAPGAFNPAAIEPSAGTGAAAPKAPDPRTYKAQLSPADKARVEGATQRFPRVKGADERLAILQSVADLCAPEVVRLVAEAQNDPTPEVRQYALNLLNGYSSADVLAAAQTGLKDGEEEVRVAAVLAMTRVEAPEVAGVLSTALRDTSPEVTDAVFQVLAQRPFGVQAPVLEGGLKSDNEMVKARTLSVLRDTQNRGVMDLLIGALRDPAPEFRDEVKSAISFLVSQDFNTYDEARAWWATNKDRYGDDLFEK